VGTLPLSTLDLFLLLRVSDRMGFATCQALSGFPCCDKYEIFVGAAFVFLSDAS
jgi:hypothetical protein